MGIVWLAQDTKLERSVALKFLPETLRLDAAARDELKRETRRSLDLTHPNLVRIYDFVENEELAAIAMEYVDGLTLSDLRVQRPATRFEVEELGPWLVELCRALDYAHHSACCVHRDLKPSNLMLTSRGNLKVADFGISCSLQNTAARVSAWTSTGGTLGYMSPQQLRGELAATSDDIYSLGATLFELLTGKPPFHSGDISFQIREVPAKSVHAQRAELGGDTAPIPQVWEDVIAACLAKSAHERPVSAVDVLQRLGLAHPHSALPAEMPTLRDLPVSSGAPPKPRLARKKLLLVLPLLLATAASLALVVRQPSHPVAPKIFPVAQVPVASPAFPSPALPVAPAEEEAAPEDPAPVPAVEQPSVPQVAMPPVEIPAESVTSLPPETLPVPVFVEESTPGSFAATPPSPSGSINVESQPAGAEIFCDGVSMGRAPLALNREPGTYVLTAKFEGRTARPRNAVVTDSGKETVRFIFERQASSTTRRTAKKKPAPEESAFTKIGRSIKNIFTNDKPKKN
jgi:serine/threonine protein kinase